MPGNGPECHEGLRSNRLRIDGTRNLLDASALAGARRFIVGSFALLAPREPAPRASEDEVSAAIRSLEDQALDATRRGVIEGVILWHGMFYGREAASTVAMIDMVRKRRLPVVRGDSSQLPVINIEDAVSATMRALAAAPAGAVYDIVDDKAVSLTAIVEALAEYTGSPRPLRVPGWVPALVAPYLARITSTRMPLSNARARAELGWQPKYPTVREGVKHMFQQAA